MAEAGDHTVLEATRRPDGSLRKPVRVRAGYVPPDEQEKYRSRGALWKEAQEHQGPIGFVGTVESKPLTKGQKKNLRKKRTKKHEDTNTDGDVQAAATGMEQLAVKEQPRTQGTPTPVEIQGDDDPEKARKKIEKKLRQAQALRDRVNAGEIEPDESQQEKIARIPDLEDAIRRAAEIAAKLGTSGSSSGSTGAGVAGGMPLPRAPAASFVRAGLGATAAAPASLGPATTAARAGLAATAGIEELPVRRDAPLGMPGAVLYPAGAPEPEPEPEPEPQPKAIPPPLQPQQQLLQQQPFLPGPPGGRARQTLWVGHLPPQVSEEELYWTFSPIAPVSLARRVPHGQYGLVSFADEGGAVHTLHTLNGFIHMHGAQYPVDWATAEDENAYAPPPPPPQQHPGALGPNAGAVPPPPTATGAPAPIPTPPPEDPALQQRIYKTAEFVVRNGDEFERMMRVKQQGIREFSFLYGGNGSVYYEWIKHCCHMGWSQERIDEEVRRYLAPPPPLPPQPQPPAQAPFPPAQAPAAAPSREGYFDPPHNVHKLPAGLTIVEPIVSVDESAYKPIDPADVVRSLPPAPSRTDERLLDRLEDLYDDLEEYGVRRPRKESTSPRAR